MNNGVYGKIMENLRNRIDVRLASIKKGYLKWTSKPSYMLQKIFDKELVAILKSKITLTLNKPAYVGLGILDLSKVVIYKFHYDHIIYKYGSNSKQLFTDTVYLKYEIKTEDIYEDFSKEKVMFDFINYSNKPKYHNDLRRLILDKIKDETAVVAIKEVFGLK